MFWEYERSITLIPLKAKFASTFHRKAMAIKATQRAKVSGGWSAGFAPGSKNSTRWSRVDALPS
jgi:hypothetical protein